MTKKFFVLANKDSAAGYIASLERAGFERMDDWGKAHFMLIDGEHAGGVRKRIGNFLKTRPAFVYPHTPLAYFIWDGHYEPLPIQCNFVHGEAAKRSMELYGYPNRVEVCGWNRCETKEFAPTAETRLLFVPARTRGNGGYTSHEYAEKTPLAWQWILDNRKSFEHITVCYVGGFVDEEKYKDTGIEFVKTFPGQAKSPAEDMLKRIGAVDLVISCESVLCLAVAVGKPAIAYNGHATPTTGFVPAAKYELYRQFYEFPLTLEDLSLQDVLAVRTAKNIKVEKWKEENIGGLFDHEKFISIIREHL